MLNSEIKPSAGTTVVIDLETNGLLKNTTEIHCIAVHYVEEGITVSYNDTGLTEPIWGFGITYNLVKLIDWR